MVRQRNLIALGAFISTLTVAAASLLGVGLSSRSAAPEVPILASGPTTATAATAAPTTVTLPPTTVTTSTTSTTSTTVAATTLPPATAAPRPPTTPAAPKAAVIAAPRAAAPRPVVASPPATSSPGNASDYQLIGYRWNPCQVITVSSSGPDVSGVVAELASITGLHLQMVGSGGQIAVAWGATPIGGEVGQTDWRSMGPWMVSAIVTLNQVLGLIYLPTLLRHELGHALGLDHASRSNEIMYGNVGLGSPTAYQAGDLAGLRAVGAAAGC